MVDTSGHWRVTLSGQSSLLLVCVLLVEIEIAGYYFLRADKEQKMQGTRQELSASLSVFLKSQSAMLRKQTLGGEYPLRKSEMVQREAMQSIPSSAELLRSPETIQRVSSRSLNPECSYETSGETAPTSVHRLQNLL